MGTTAERFPWKRRWVPEGAELPLDADGFYAEPEDEFLQSLCVGRELSELREIPCLVLLGEAGMGKTTVVRDDVATTGGGARVIDLATIGDLAELTDEIEATISDGASELFFDSLDEARLRIPTIVDSLGRTLRRIRERSRVIRVVCRSGEWPRDGSSRLEEHLGNGTVKT